MGTLGVGLAVHKYAPSPTIQISIMSDTESSPTCQLAPAMTQARARVGDENATPNNPNPITPATNNAAVTAPDTTESGKKSKT